MKKSKKVHHKPAKKKSRPKSNKTSGERIKSGIDNLDHLIEGGFEKGTINLIAGPSGSGKSIFAMQFLVEGMKKGEKCLYVTFEEKKEQMYRNMLEFGWDLQEYENKGLFTLLEYAPEKVKLMLEEGGGSIETIVLTKKISRLVIDSITSFALLFENELIKRESALSLFNMIKEWNCTSIVTLDDIPSKDATPNENETEFESDSIMIIYFLRNGNERERYLEIMKMKGTSHSRKVYKLNIEKAGAKLDKKPLSKQTIKSLGI